ncbi:MAG: hypothetical protein G01um101438_11 [Parcubacteria group bacterium Gr01-1014_38]|nr:MAG: hypothetical protein G01um101438_11 [Parcubacteria group bacterium Gr01-1014_38]
MKTSELRRLDVQALRARANELLAQIAALRFGIQQKEKNVKKLRELRRERARVLTILREQKGSQV